MLTVDSTVRKFMLHLKISEHNSKVSQSGSHYKDINVTSERRRWEL